MNIIVNGGTRGIGKEVVNILAQDIKNHILVTGRNEIALKSLSNLFRNVHTMSLDLSHFDEHIVLFKETIYSCFKSVDILINMSGLLIAKDFMNISKAEARAMMEINFLGPASMIREVKPLMKKGSHIVNISSMGGFQSSVKFRGLSYYSASKASIACLSECLAVEFMDSGIHVNCLALGAVQTEMLKEAFPGYKAPLNAREISEFISDFALKGHKFFNGRIIPVAIGNP
jgi:NAD(P)-dependent dehydrogenase (short-subunit alcohol dehydrogenase family)